MDDKTLRRYGPKFHALDVVIMPPVIFLVSWGAVKLYHWTASAHEGADWRTPITAGLFMALLGHFATMYSAVPRSMRELRFMTVWMLISGLVLVGLFVYFNNDDSFSSTGLGLGAVIVVLLTFMDYRRMVREFSDNPPTTTEATPHGTQSEKP